MRERRSNHVAPGMVAVLLLGAVAAAGCSQAMRSPMPDMTGPLAVTVSPEGPSKSTDLPTGIHQVPDTAVYISGYQGESMKIGQHFGLVGVLAAEAAASRTSEKKAESAQGHLRLDLARWTERVVAQEIPRAGATRLVVNGAGGNGALELVPYLVVSSTGNDQVRPWIFLKTTLKDPAGETKWKTRYIVSLGAPRPLGGPNGWATGDGATFRAAVDAGLRRAVILMMKDTSGGLARTGGRPAKVKTQWPWVKEPLVIAADVLEETPDSLIVLPKVGDLTTFAGINVLDKASVSVTPTDN
ncbi:MAG TPA: hypothetical protein VGL09_03945 [Methylomirabilota bacterium]